MTTRWPGYIIELRDIKMQPALERALSRREILGRSLRCPVRQLKEGPR